jgi:hypothetical protein
MADGHLRLSRESVRARLARRALIDPGFRQRLNADPTAAANELGIVIPSELRVAVLDEGDNQMLVVVAAPESRVDGLHPMLPEIDPAIDRIATAHLRTGKARLKVGTAHVTDQQAPEVGDDDH